MGAHAQQRINLGNNKPLRGNFALLIDGDTRIYGGFEMTPSRGGRGLPTMPRRGFGIKVTMERVRLCCRLTFRVDSDLDSDPELVRLKYACVSFTGLNDHVVQVKIIDNNTTL